MAEAPSVRDGAQHCENKRENSFLNYGSPALTAELQARMISELNHAKRLRPTPKTVQTSNVLDGTKLVHAERIRKAVAATTW
jgi:hypothetical protein